MWGLGIGGVMLVVALTGPQDKKTDSRGGREVKHVLTDFDTRKVGVDSLAANIKLLYAEHNSLSRELGGIRHQLELLRRNPGLIGANGDFSSEAGDLAEEVRNMREELKLIKTLLPKEMQSLKKQLKEEGRNTDGAESGEPISRKESKDQVHEKRNSPSGKYGGSSASDDIERFKKNSPGREREFRRENSVLPGTSSPERHIRSVSDARFAELSNRGTPDERGLSRHLKGNGDRGYYIPAGSILSGILLTGLDAPTRENARTDPFPVLINIDREAILPNSRSFDFNECFVIAAGFGDMSSERVYLRTETLNCVAESGRVMETPLNGYAAGEDGKAGIRGRLVSKQGVLIARSLTAGFLEGLAGAFNVTPVPVISTTGGSGSVDYQSVYSGRALQGAAVSGSSKALERVASFYLKLAEEMFPVLEVDAARRVDIILTKGISLDYALND